MRQICNEMTHYTHKAKDKFAVGRFSDIENENVEALSLLFPSLFTFTVQECFYFVHFVAVQPMSYTISFTFVISGIKIV